MKKILFAATLAVAAIIVSSSCENPPIFAAIEQEVKLNPASVTGFVRGVVRIRDEDRDTLYASNGKIFYKTTGSQGKWSGMSRPNSENDRCISIATDGANLYASFGNDGTFKAYKYASSKWIELPGAAASAQYVVGTDTVFAFDPNAGKIYTISGDTEWPSWDNTTAPVGAAGTYCLLEDGLYTTTGSKITGSDSPTSGLKGICKGPENSVFVFDNSMLYCYDGNAWTKVTHGVSNPQSICYLSNKQLVLLSGIKGYGEIKLASLSAVNLENAKTVSAGSPDSSILSENYYQYTNSVGKYTLNPINAFDQGADGYIIYVGVNDPNTRYTGLWGFYNPNRKQWNRE